jgi:hypothetical protein
MSLVRTALRLCAVAALQDVTIAQGRVYDSRIGDIQPETFLEDAKPTVIVLTDGDAGEQLSHQNGGPPFDRMVDLVFELGMVQTQKADGDQAATSSAFQTPTRGSRHRSTRWNSRSCAVWPTSSTPSRRCFARSCGQSNTTRTARCSTTPASSSPRGS